MLDEECAAANCLVCVPAQVPLCASWLQRCHRLLRSKLAASRKPPATAPRNTIVNTHMQPLSHLPALPCLTGLAGYPEECKPKPGFEHSHGEEGASCVTDGQCCDGLVCADRGEAAVSSGATCLGTCERMHAAASRCITRAWCHGAVVPCWHCRVQEHHPARQIRKAVHFQRE